MGIHTFFPTHIYQAPVLNPRSTLLHTLISECSIIRRGDRQGEEWSKANYMNGYTSYGSMDSLHELSPHFHELGQKIRSHLGKYLGGLSLDVKPGDLKLSKMWMNHMEQGCSHSFHIHPLSVISGTVYLKTPPKCSAIKFEDPRHGLFMGRPPLKPSAPQGLRNHISVQPKSGEVILFESWLRHEVPPNPSKQARLSVSFNFDW